MGRTTGGAGSDRDAESQDRDATSTIAELPSRRQPPATTVANTPAGRGVATIATSDARPARDLASSEALSLPTSAPTALATLRAEEVENARMIIRLGRLGGIALLLLLPLLGGGVALRIVFAGALVVAIGVGAWLELVFRDPDRYSEVGMFVLACAVAVAAYCALLYWGLFSAAQMFPVMAIYFYARREKLWPPLVLFVAAVITQSAAAAAFISGLVPDPGYYRPDLPVHVLIAAHLLIQAAFIGAFLLGRHSHRAGRAAIERMVDAVQLASQREAQLHEAQHDLDRALQLGGAGRYTDQTFGSFRLGHVLGRGGMGEVYEATHAVTGELAAVKLLSLRAQDNPRHVARFLREVRAARSIESPHVVRVLEACEPTDTIPYFAMELLRGHDLAHHLRGGVAPADLDKLLAEVGAALDVARARGVVHRDLKPSNLFLAEQPDEPIWKVLDFGVATLAECTGTLTEGHVVGTPGYMAPEQARGASVDHRADLYALGAIAYRWLVGRPAFAGRDFAGLLYKVAHTMPPRPSAFGRLPTEVDAVLAVALAKDPAARFDSARELREALRDALAGRLDSAVRRRADRVLAAHPWGAR